MYSTKVLFGSNNFVDGLGVKQMIYLADKMESKILQRQMEKKNCFWLQICMLCPSDMTKDALSETENVLHFLAYLYHVYRGAIVVTLVSTNRTVCINECLG